MNSINCNIKSVEVKATTRPLRATWTTEMAKDISAYSGFDWNSWSNTILIRAERSEKLKKILDKI